MILSTFLVFTACLCSFLCWGPRLWTLNVEALPKDFLSRTSQASTSRHNRDHSTAFLFRRSIGSSSSSKSHPVVRRRWAFLQHATTRPTKIFDDRSNTFGTIQGDVAVLKKEQSPFVLFATSSATQTEKIDLDQTFQSIADSEGYVTKEGLLKVPEIKELLMDDDLLQQEDVDEIWQKYVIDQQQQKANFETFVKIYSEIDDLFEEEDEDDDEVTDANENTKENAAESATMASIDTTPAELTEDAESRQELEEIFKIISSKAAVAESIEGKEGEDSVKDQLQEEQLAGGVLSKEALRGWDEIDTLIVDGMLGEEEFEDLWEKTPKNEDGNVDLNGFIEFNSFVDELFDFDEEDEEESQDDDVDAEDENDKLFAKLAGKSGLVTKDQLMNEWDDLKEMLSDGDILAEEFDKMYQSSLKQSKDDVALDEKAFAVLRNGIDDLFEDEEDVESDADGEENASPATAAVTSENVESNTLDNTLFQSLAGPSGLMSKETLLNKWEDLQDMLKEGDLMSEEFEQFFSSALSKSKDSSALDENAFNTLKYSIDDLFEDGEGVEAMGNTKDEGSFTSSGSTKDDLLRTLSKMEETRIAGSEEPRLPCGLESTEAEEKLILKLANTLIADQDSNMLLKTGGNIKTSQVAGSWKLLYTSSSAMKFNKGLSGIGGSFPNGRFGGVIQTLSGSSLLPDVEYKERIEVKKPGSSFDVTVTGNWELRQSMSLFTGEKSIVLAIEPDRVKYGPTSTKADHWKSLGPTNMLDLVYLDEDLRIMRGSTSMDTILIFQRV